MKSLIILALCSCIGGGTITADAVNQAISVCQSNGGLASIYVFASRIDSRCNNGATFIFQSK